MNRADVPKIYHITHVDNLPSILESGQLKSDATMIAEGGPLASIGMGSIKSRRLNLPVKAHPGDKVGGYVPFYFCPRSVMLYIIHQANHPELAYRGGQQPIIHLEADLHRCVRWAEAESRRWAFTLSNAGAVYTEFRSKLDQLQEVDWHAVGSTDFRDAAVKEGKQAEFLVKDTFPFTLFDRIGVFSPTIHARTTRALADYGHKPTVEVIRSWYY